jgi:hypothetical protein
MNGKPVELSPRKAVRSGGRPLNALLCRGQWLAGEVDESHLLRFLRLSISLFAPVKIRVTAITKTMQARAAGPELPPTRDATMTIGETTAARPSTR